MKLNGPTKKEALSGAKKRIGVYPGQFFDNETGLHYNYHRYYDPKIGRYLRSDPAGIMKGTNHLYVYARNNPLLYIDMFGLDCIIVDAIRTYLGTTDIETVVYGEWIYDRWHQAANACWCVWLRDKSIDVERRDRYRVQKALKCTEKDKCGKEKVYYKFQTDFEENVEYFSKYGGSETKRVYGAMTGTGEGVESGSDCGCRPLVNPNPPGWYRGR